MPASRSSFRPDRGQIQFAPAFLRLLFFFCRITDPQGANIGDCDAAEAWPQREARVIGSGE
jgi:hypothetical protein